MGRRIALSLAFCFTTVVGFAIVALGSSVGFFNWSEADESFEAPLAVGGDSWWWQYARAPMPLVVAEIPAVSAPAPPPPAPAAEPQVITEYIYVDQYVTDTPEPAAVETPAPSPTPDPALSLPILPDLVTAAPSASSGAATPGDSSAVLAASSPEPEASNGGAAEVGLDEEGLKGTVLEVYDDGSFLLETKYGEFVLVVDDGTDVKQGTVIEEGAQLKTKVEVVAGTYQTPNDDGTFDATKVSTDDKPKPPEEG